MATIDLRLIPAHTNSYCLPEVLKSSSLFWIRDKALPIPSSPVRSIGGSQDLYKGPGGGVGPIGSKGHNGGSLSG